MGKSWSAHDAWKLRFLDAASRPFIKPCADPLWVFGIQKAGTTAFAKTLATATGHSSLMDTPLLWDLWLRPPSSEDLAQIMRRHPITFSPKVLKEPTTTFFPQACLKQTLRKRHVLIVRDPASNIRSAMDRFQLPGDGSIPAHSTLRPAYREFMDQTRSTPPLALAERWVLAYDQRIWLDPDIAVFRYEDFVATPHRVIEKAANHLGWDIVADFDFAIKAEHQPAGKNRATPVLEFFGPSTLEQIKLRTQGPYERLMNRAR